MAGGYYPGPVETVGPMDESFIGGFKQPPPSPRPPTVPPKEHHYFNGAHMPQAAHYTPSTQSSSLTVSTSQLSGMSAVERSQVLRIARMEPHLQVCWFHSKSLFQLIISYQFMCGPLLKSVSLLFHKAITLIKPHRYDTTDEHGIWHGAALIVSEFILPKYIFRNLTKKNHSLRQQLTIRPTSISNIHIRPRTANPNIHPPTLRISILPFANFAIPFIAVQSLSQRHNFKPKPKLTQLPTPQTRHINHIPQPLPNPSVPHKHIPRTRPAPCRSSFHRVSSGQQL